MDKMNIPYPEPKSVVNIEPGKKNCGESTVNMIHRGGTTGGSKLYGFVDVAPSRTRMRSSFIFQFVVKFHKAEACRVALLGRIEVML
jgi:hypothetical protein